MSLEDWFDPFLNSTAPKIWVPLPAAGGKFAKQLKKICLRQPESFHLIVILYWMTGL